VYIEKNCEQNSTPWSWTSSRRPSLTHTSVITHTNAGRNGGIVINVINGVGGPPTRRAKPHFILDVPIICIIVLCTPESKWN